MLRLGYRGRYVAREVEALGVAFEVTTEDGKRIALVELPDCEYVLPNGSHVPAAVDVVWCNSCDGFSAGESIPQLPALERILAGKSTDLMPDEAPLFTGDYETDRQELISATKKQIEWLLLRKGLPKCIPCGSSDICKLPVDCNEFPHPNSGDQIAVSFVIELAETESKKHWLDIDGNMLG